jgi:hypothetical protein
LVAGTNLQDVASVSIGGQSAQIVPALPAHSDFLMIRPASDVAIGPTSIILRTAFGGERSLPVSILSTLPSGPAGPPELVIPNVVSLGAFDPGGLIDFWVNEFDPDDTRYFFADVDQAETRDLYEVANSEGFTPTLAGAYDSTTALFRFTLSDVGIPTEEYIGVLSDTDPNCPRLVLFPRDVGVQLVLVPSGRADCSLADEVP